MSFSMAQEADFIKRNKITIYKDTTTYKTIIEMNFGIKK